MLNVPVNTNSVMSGLFYGLNQYSTYMYQFTQYTLSALFLSVYLKKSITQIDKQKHVLKYHFGLVARKSYKSAD